MFRKTFTGKVFLQCLIFEKFWFFFRYLYLRPASNLQLFSDILDSGFRRKILKNEGEVAFRKNIRNFLKMQRFNYKNTWQKVPRFIYHLDKPPPPYVNLTTYVISDIPSEEEAVLPPKKIYQIHTNSCVFIFSEVPWSTQLRACICFAQTNFKYISWIR